MKKLLPKLSTLFLFVCIIYTNSFAQTGTWTKVATNAPHRNSGVCLLLTDGRVICKSYGGSGNYGTVWDILTPDATGSYVNGTWSSTAGMNYDRLFFSSQVLPSGKVYVAGGEYSSYPTNDAGETEGEVYDPVANTWTTCGAMVAGDNVFDGNSELLYDGNVLEGPQKPAGSQNIMFWNPAGIGTYSAGPNAPLNHDEAAWLKLPDSSVLYIGINSTNSCRYIPQTNTWLTDATVTNNIYDPYGEESGCAIFLPNGKAIFFGSSKFNCIYTPTGHATVGTWAAAANMPTIGTAQTGQVDAPGAMMVNGHILLGVSPGNLSAGDQFRSPLWWVEYNYITNTFTQVTSVIPGIGADSLAGVPSNFGQLLDLPDGTVLMSICQEHISDEYWVYTPGSAAIPQGKPVFDSIRLRGCGIYEAFGKLFNGISEGAGFGDDWQMSTNYPLVRLTNGTNVWYAKTTNWNRLGFVASAPNLAADSLLDSCTFTLPAGLTPGTTYTAYVSVNGFQSNLALITTPGETIMSSTGVLCNGGSTGTAKAGTPVGSLAPYSYVWTPGGNTNITITGLSAGTYTVTATDKRGCTTSASVTINQPAAFVITPGSVNVNSTGPCNGQASVSITGGTAPYTYHWSPGGGTTDTINGKCKGTYCCTITDKNGCKDSTCITILNVTGIENINNASDINIYPDPNSGSFTIAGIVQGQVIELYNDLGQKLSSSIATQPTMYFDISNKVDGLYLVRILNKDGSLVTEKKIMKVQ